MNSLLKIVIISTLLLFLVSTASAAYTDMNALDANSVRHANRGEDFNVSISAAQTADVNADYNYLVVLSYRSIYVDLNVKVWAGTTSTASAKSDNRIDANVVTMTLSGAGPCARGGDYNVITFKPGDMNTFNVTVTVPTTTNNCSTCSDMNHLVGKEVAVEVWPLTVAGVRTGVCGSTYDANAPFIIGPAIIVKTPNINQLTAKVDQNITVMGFGFYRGDFNVVDKNVTISFVDANNAVGAAGSILNAHTRTVWGKNDLNILNIAHGAVKQYHKAGVGDTNDAVRSLAGVVFRTDINGAVGWSEDWNGITVYPDTNGEFDVNITVPYLTPSTIGSSDLNTLRATTTLLGDINTATFVITPNITMPAASDMNVTVTIGGVHHQISDAMSQNLISNMQAVSGFIVRMGKIVGLSGTIELRAVTVRMNSDINMAKGPQRNYNDMNTAPVGGGRAEIDTTSMPEFAIDANIFLYNVKVPSGEMPILARNGIVCPTTTCKNLDGTALSSTYTDSFQTDQAGNSVRTWTYNPVAGDGNLAFRVSTFSVYQAGTLSIEVVTPNGGEKIRTPRRNADANYTFTFNFKDTNTQDNNWAAIGTQTMSALIYYSTVGGGKTGVIIKDQNLFDNSFVDCNGTSQLARGTIAVSTDINLAHWQTCTFDLNRADLNYIIGEYVVDVNILTPWHDTDAHTTSVIGYSDANVFFNPPLIEITDTNLNTADFVIQNGLSTCPPRGCNPDINYEIDFNIYLPMDVNRDFNSGMPLNDYNIHFYLASTQTGITNARDFNHTATGLRDTNAVPSGNRTFASIGVVPMAYLSCTQPPATAPFFDYSCTAQFDLNWTPEGKYYLIAKIFNSNIKTSGVRTQTSWTAHTIDSNELWDINASALSFVVNDDNRPRASQDITTSTTSSYYDMQLTCDDNISSNIRKYLFREGTESWIDNGTTSTNRFSIGGATLPATRTYYGGCMDDANNISDVNITHNITFESGGGGPVTPPPSEDGGDGGGVTPPPGVPTTETILAHTVTKKPTAAEITSILTAAGASQTAIDKASAAVAKTSVARTITVEKTTAADGTVSYKSTITISVENPNKSKKMTKVKVTEQIPKSVINTLKKEDITSNYAFEILKADPIIQFTIDSIAPDSSTQISYSLNKQVTTGAANAWLPPVTAELEEKAPCDGVSCPDKACQTGRCDAATGRCQYTNKADGTVCEGTKECKSGTCIEKPAPPAAAVCGNAACEAGEDSANCPGYCPAAGIDLTLPAVIIVIIIVIVAAAYYYKGKKRPKLGK